MNHQPNTESKTRQYRFAPFALAILCFALPFVEVSCQNQKADTLNGFELVVGKTYERDGQITQSERFEGMLAFQLALGCAVGAAMLCLLPSAFDKVAASAVGVAGIVALWVGKVNFEHYLHEKGEGMFHCEWVLGFFAVTFLLIIGAVMAAAQARPRAQRTPPPGD
jgi:hypothetical protein